MKIFVFAAAVVCVACYLAGAAGYTSFEDDEGPVGRFLRLAMWLGVFLNCALMLTSIALALWAFSW